MLKKKKKQIKLIKFKTKKIIKVARKETKTGK
jgi:hypothetical protein